ncbi:hypothetical protein BpHYR1_046391 [Brachionus plicatilis]|uniref:Uncharacterized protein n=1 Tax=Brachionus plicatilis TaxID=10195 RepID=A0A3M7QFW6_BRAPC|nr:hypothetical protein BpHYR1_046391 [Brachionus plicatilis]
MDTFHTYNYITRLKLVSILLNKLCDGIFTVFHKKYGNVNFKYMLNKNFSFFDKLNLKKKYCNKVNYTLFFVIDKKVLTLIAIFVCKEFCVRFLSILKKEIKRKFKTDKEKGDLFKIILKPIDIS